MGGFFPKETYVVSFPAGVLGEGSFQFGKEGVMSIFFRTDVVAFDALTVLQGCCFLGEGLDAFGMIDCWCCECKSGGLWIFCI